MRAVIACALVLAMAVPCSAAYYAVDKGVILAGGSVGFESSGGDLYENADGDKATTITFDPFAGYFFMPNLALGAHIHFSKETHGDYKASEVGFGPAAFYYFGGEYSKMFPFVSARFDWKKASSSYDDTDYPDYTYTTIGFAGGVTAMVSKNVGIRASLFYEMDTEEQEDQDSVDGNKLGLRVGIQTFIW
jgi:hypothetical protein